MSNVNLADFKTLYLSTAQEYIQKMQDGLVTLRTSPEDTAAIEVVHLSAHSLKSQSLVMGYTTTGELSHVIEVIFRKLLDERGSLSEKLISPLTEAIAGLDESVLQIEATGKEKNLSDLKENLQSEGGTTK